MISSLECPELPLHLQAEVLSLHPPLHEQLPQTDSIPNKFSRIIFNQYSFNCAIALSKGIELIVHMLSYVQ